VQSDNHIFRMEFMPVFLFVYIFGSVGGALLVPVWVTLDPTLNGEPSVLLETIGRIIIFFSPPYAGLCALFMNRYFRYTVSREGVRAMDRKAIEEFGIPGIVLMENAATALAEAALRLLDEARTPTASIYCGTGNNGGDGFALARKLANAGVDVECVLVGDREKVSGDALTNMRIAEKMGVPIRNGAGIGSPALVVDALFGTGLSRAIEGGAAGAVDRINAARESGSRVLAVDVPSGLDCETGEPMGEHAVRAGVTVTLAGMKRGLAEDRAKAYAGEVLVGDIGVPRALIERHGEG